MALAVCLASLPAVAQDDNQLTVLDLDQPLRLDFGGFWEKDYRRSDNWQDELTRKMRLRQEAAARQGGNPGAAARVSVPPISIGNINLNGSRGRGASIVDLARLAEYISRQTTLRIDQTRDEIRIEPAEIRVSYVALGGKWCRPLPVAMASRPVAGTDSS